jgi:hypothetical protein
MSRKRFLSAALGVLLLLTMSVPGALAMGETNSATESEMSVKYTYINQASTSLSISASGTATVYGVCAEDARREKHLSFVNFAAKLQRHMVERKKLVCILDVLVDLHPRNISGIRWNLQG